MTVHVAAAEASLLGALLHDPDSYWRIADKVGAADFSDKSLAALFRSLARRVEAGEEIADIVTLSDELPEHRNLILRLAADAVGTANVEAYAKITREHAQRRRLRTLLANGLEHVDNRDAAETIAELSPQLEALTQSGRSRGKDWAAVVRDAINTIDEAAQCQACSGLPGVPTGIPAIDLRTGGLVAPRLWCLAGRPGLGKSALANQIALHAAVRGHAVGIVSLEMGTDELGIRSLAHRYGANVARLWQGDQEALNCVVTGMGRDPIDGLPIFADTDTFDLPGILALIANWKRKHAIELAIVDYVGLVEVSGYATRNEALGAVSRALKKLAKRLDLPILVLSQLNRSVEKERRRPRLSDLRDSGNIEQDVDVALFLHTDPDTEADSRMPVELGLLKNRAGRRGWLPERIEFDGPTQTFREIETARHRVTHAVSPMVTT